MTEKALIDEYWRYIRDCKPQKMEEFKAYIKGTGPWPEGIVSSRHRPVYERSSFPEDIELELGGKNDALALHILKAVVLSMPKETIPYHEAGIRVLHSLGVPFEDVYGGIENSPTMDPWTIYKYYPDEAKAFLESQLATPTLVGEFPAQISKIGPDKKLYAPNLAIAAELAVADPVKYKSFIPLIESFVENQLAEWDKDSENSYWVSQRCARRAAVVAGDLSPALQKLRRRILFDMSFPENSYTMDELWEIGKKIGITEEWFEILLLQGSMNETKLKDLPKTPAELAEHLRKLYKENKALFEKTHRAFYWQFEGKKITDDIPHPPKKSFIYSLYLLSIWIENGEGKKEIAELAKNWDTLIEIRENDFLGQTSGDYDYTRPFAANYESGIPQLDAVFNKTFAARRSRNDDTSDYFSLGLRILIDLRGQWCGAASTVKAFADTTRISVDDFHNAFNTIKHAQRHAGGGSVPFGPFPSELIREYTRLHQDETRAYIESNLAVIGAKPVRQEYRAEDFPNWVKAVFTPGPSDASAGLPITDVLILFGAKSKRVFLVLEELLANREAEVRAELETRLPKYKKDASETAQRLIARWNTKKAK